ncbi:MAG: class I SAM-dependent methyltransferase [Synechococcales cyanobacterium]
MSAHTPLSELLKSYASQPLDSRKRWYSPAALAYLQTRPRYPQDLIDQVVAQTQLQASSTVLEIGCGPGTATQALAPLGCALEALEPNADFFQLAQEVCRPYPKVRLHNVALEEWAVTPAAYDVVVAASSFHWLPPDLAQRTIPTALRPGGWLVLLWNQKLEPTWDVYQSLAPIYQALAPALDRYVSLEEQLQTLDDLANVDWQLECFGPWQRDHRHCQTIYTSAQYVTLLSTYSPYLQLEDNQRQSLFAAIRDQVDQQWGGEITLDSISAVHMAQKVTEESGAPVASDSVEP